jgi:hypothetical protein
VQQAGKSVAWTLRKEKRKSETDRQGKKYTTGSKALDIFFSAFWCPNFDWGKPTRRDRTTTSTTSRRGGERGAEGWRTTLGERWMLATREV